LSFESTTPARVWVSLDTHGQARGFLPFGLIKKAIKITKKLKKSCAVFMIHTSPFFRNNFYNPPFIKL